MNGAPLIAVEHLTMRFGGLVAVDDVSFTARPREITAIIGPNGAGKTTVFNCITGFYKPTVGRLTLRADREYLLERMIGHEIGQKAKVARTFQNIRLFPGMTVLENLMVAQHNKLMLASGMSVFGLFGLKRYRDHITNLEDVLAAWTPNRAPWCYKFCTSPRLSQWVLRAHLKLWKSLKLEPAASKNLSLAPASAPRS